MLNMFAAVRRDGQWHKVGKEFVSTFEELEGQLTDRVYDGRDKGLIEFLKKQCNGGVPMGMSAELMRHNLFDDVPIWHATVIELLGFDWDRPTHKTGYISKWQYKRLKEGVVPSNILSENTVQIVRRSVVRPFEADLILQHPALQKYGNNFYVVYEYDHCSFKNLCKFFCETSIPALINLIPEDGTVEDVRIVFSIT